MKNLTESLLDEELEVSINGNKDTLTVIDWDQIKSEHDIVMEKIENMTREERSDYISFNQTKVMEIRDYFITKDCEAKVEAKEWVPFGLLGLCYRPDSYAEMSNSGLLLFDLTQDDRNDPPVILCTDTETQTLVKHFSELEISKVA